MEEVRLKYGNEEILFEIDGAKSVRYLEETPMPVIQDVEQRLIHCLTAGAIDSPPLDALISKEDKITIIISDITRLWMNQDVLTEILVKYLNGTLGVVLENIAVVIALGTHRKSSEEEKRKVASQYVYDNVGLLVDHDCDAEDLVYVGTTSLGTEVKVNVLAVGRKVICIGGTVHHIMAGYGGGRKSIVPGIAGRESIRMNHERALDPTRPMSNEQVGSGKVLTNPLHMDMREAGAMVDVVFGINVVVDSASQFSELFCGAFNSAWEASCRYVQKSYGLPIDYEADVVVASCGGFPKDLNFYQSTKSLFNAVRAVKQGGTLVLLAECPEGVGSKDFFDWAEPLRKGCLDEALRKDFTIGGYVFYASCEAIKKANTLLLGKVDKDEMKPMGVTAFTDAKELFEQVTFRDKDVYIMPYGGNVMPQLRDEYEEFCKNI